MDVDWTPENIKTLREVLGMSRRQMASDISVSPSLLADIEAGQRYATQQILARIGSLYHDHLHRIDFSIKEGDNADVASFLQCVQKSFPLSNSGGSDADRSNNLVSGHFDLLLPTVDEERIRSQIQECASRCDIEVLNLHRKKSI